jgi:hypothetical protein
MQSHPNGFRRLIGLDYPWFIASITLFLSQFIQQFEAKCVRFGDIIPNKAFSKAKLILKLIWDSIFHPIPLLRAKLIF